MSLLDDLGEAERQNTQGRECQMCVAIEMTAAPEARTALIRAAAGTIGRDKLVEILRRNGLPASRRAIERHRNERHEP